MNQLIKDYCDAVCLKVKHASNREKADIEKELSDHIQDHQEYLVHKGFSEDDALKKAIMTMGSPEEVGDELNKQYPLFWLVVSRIPIVLAILLFFQVFSIPYVFQSVYDNYLARTNPLKEFNRTIENGFETNYRIDFPENNVLYIYAVNIRDKNAYPFDTFYDLDYSSYDYVVTINACVYHKNPLKMASQAILTRIVPSGIKGEHYHLHKGFFSNISDVEFSVPLRWEDPCIYIDYSEYGLEIHEKLPLNWEVVK